LRPVLEGVIPYAALIRTELRLVDIAILNDALDVKAENQQRIMEAMEQERNASRK
jgi:hypothetical protein